MLNNNGAFQNKLCDSGQVTTSLGKTEGIESSDFKAAHSTQDYIYSFTSLKVNGIEGFTVLILTLGVGKKCQTKASLSIVLTSLLNNVMSKLQ